MSAGVLAARRRSQYRLAHSVHVSQPSMIWPRIQAKALTPLVMATAPPYASRNGKDDCAAVILSEMDPGYH